MREEIIQKFVDYCSNGHTPLTLQKLLKENASSLGLQEEHVLWFKKYVHRVRDIVGSDPGHKTLLGFKNNGTHTSYSLKKLYKKDSHTSFRDWLVKLEEIELLCRYDQPDDLEKWGKKKVYAINPSLRTVVKMILEVINKVHYTSSI